MEEHKDRTLILLATYNGARFLQEQLDSFLAQSERNWDVLVSDDASSDETLEILNLFKNRVRGNHTVTIVDGPKLGSAHNFLSLIKKIPDGTARICFSDQDDVWAPDKLERARTKIDAIPDQNLPILYAAGSFICDVNLTPIKATARTQWVPSFPNALVQSIGGGNTMMLNNAAIQLLKSAAHEVAEVAFHDWWAYQIISGCGGLVLRDSKQVLYYRQHDGNVVGSNTSLKGKLQRIAFVSSSRFVKWNDTSIAALCTSLHRLTPEAQRSLSHYQKARSGNILRRLCALKKSGASRQSFMGTIALYVACIAGKL